jgi:hypothetical protein
MQHSESEKKLSEPIANDLLTETLIVVAQIVQKMGEIPLCIDQTLPSQYSMIMMSSSSALKNYS